MFGSIAIIVASMTRRCHWFHSQSFSFIYILRDQSIPHDAFIIDESIHQVKRMPNNFCFEIDFLDEKLSIIILFKFCRIDNLYAFNSFIDNKFIVRYAPFEINAIHFTLPCYTLLDLTWLDFVTIKVWSTLFQCICVRLWCEAALWRIILSANK